MDLFEYISVLSSIIIGVGLAQLMRGVVQIIHHPEDGKPYWVHLVWVASTFLLAIVWWWIQFKLTTLDLWTFGWYSLVLAYAVSIYLMCAILFPSHMGSFESYKDFFYAKRVWFFSFFILERLVDIVDTLAKGGVDRVISLGPEYWMFGPLQIILAGIAIYTRNEKYHAVFAVFVILVGIFATIRIFPTMG